ncbi:MAG: AI-2E family transporter YdiK [Proteobacteria bacterium]|nr:AI-2E family transporter YdiK [Pseudomonadota bacterium]
MVTTPQLPDYPRIIVIVLLISLMVGASLWILEPFLPALIWSTMIVVATWPVLLRVQRLVRGRRAIAVTVMTFLILVLMAVPLVLASAQLVQHSDVILAGVNYVTTHNLPPPPAWVGRIPLAGPMLAERWTEFAAADPLSLLRPLAPYAGAIAAWIAARAGGLGAFGIHLVLIVVLCAVLYQYGELGAEGVMRFARRVDGNRGTETIMLAAHAIRAVAMGIVVTAIVQSVLGGIGLAVAGIPYATLLTVLMFVLCVAQIGVLPVLVPAIIWLFWREHTAWGIFLVVWSTVVGLMDNVLRPLLIRRGANVPLLLIMAGVIGGLLAFGGVGLFVGPVVLAVAYTLIKAWVEQGTPPANADKA